MLAVLSLQSGSCKIELINLSVLISLCTYNLPVVISDLIISIFMIVFIIHCGLFQLGRLVDYSITAPFCLL